MPGYANFSLHYELARPSGQEATRIDGKEIAKGIREKLNADIATAQRNNPNFVPRLVIFQGETNKVLPHSDSGPDAAVLTFSGN